MRFFLIVILLISFFFVSAQDQAYITIYDAETKQTLQKLIVKAKDSIRIRPIVDNYIYSHIEKGYPLASVDSIKGSYKSGFEAYAYLGPKLKTLRIEAADEQTQSLIKAVPGMNEKLLAQLPLTSRDVIQMKKKILNYLENNGHPFAKLVFESLDFTKNPSVKLKIVLGPVIKWSKINIKGDLKLSRNFIMTLLEIREGDLYSEEKFQRAAQRLSQVSFITLSQTPQIAFFPEGAELFLYLTKRQASSANGILGMQPNQSGKVVFTGDIQLRLTNSLGFGEHLQLVWKNLMPQSPQLNVAANVPFLFKSKFGTESKFHLYKRDSSFLEVKGNLGIRYFLGRNNYVKGFYNFESSNVLSGAVSNPMFSDGISVRINGYGIGFERQVLDYLPNPRQGFKIDFQTAFGTRKTYPLDDNNLSIEGTRSNVYRSSLSTEFFIPFGKRSTIRLGAQGQFYYADTIYANEQIRFGGLQSMRGFDEESLMATTMAVATLEYRFLLDQNSHFLFFFDQGLYENRTRSYVRDLPFGFGAGLSFGTKAGMFSIIYALGRQFYNPIDLRDGKIHIGYLAVF